MTPLEGGWWERGGQFFRERRGCNFYTKDNEIFNDIKSL